MGLFDTIELEIPHVFEKQTVQTKSMLCDETRYKINKLEMFLRWDPEAEQWYGMPNLTQQIEFHIERSRFSVDAVDGRIEQITKWEDGFCNVIFVSDYRLQDFLECRVKNEVAKRVFEIQAKSEEGK